MSFSANLKPVQSGEPVSAGVVNRPLGQLDARTIYLKDVLKDVEAGQTLILRDETIDPAVTVGTPVYWNPDLQRFDRAYALVGLDTATQTYVKAPEADTIGLLCKKHSAYSGDIVMFGVINLPEIKEVLGEGTGRFFLGADPGTLTFDDLTVSVPVGQVFGITSACSTEYKVYVNPEYSKRIFDTIAYTHDLTPKQIMIDTLPGWLAVTPEDNAPAGALYKYNIQGDSVLKKLWPPIPLDAVSCIIDWNTTGDTIGGKEITVNKPSSLIHADMSNIWWMTDEVTPFSNASTSQFKVFRTTLKFSKVQFANKKLYVNSLRPYEDHPFEFVDCNGEVATFGDLFAKFTLAERYKDSELFDGFALRRITEDYYQEVAPSVQGLYATDTSVILQSENSVEIDNKQYATGLVNISVDTFQQDYETSMQIVKLFETLESDFSGITYIGLPYSRPSSFIAKLEIPANFTSDTLEFKARCLFLALRSGSHPALVMDYFVVPRPEEGLSVIANTTYSPMVFNSERTVSAGTCFEVESEPVLLTKGDTLMLRVARPAESSYATEVAVVRLNGILNRSE